MAFEEGTIMVYRGMLEKCRLDHAMVVPEKGHFMPWLYPKKAILESSLHFSTIPCDFALFTFASGC
jgi:hypothetical protein